MSDNGDMEQVSDPELKEVFFELYSSFMLHYYADLFHRADDNGNGEGGLTTVETLCMEIIHYMKNPSINEFANVIGISSPNATYKVNSLIKKGYLEKIQSSEDKREFYLKETPKFRQDYNRLSGYSYRMARGIQTRMDQDKVNTIKKILDFFAQEDEKEESLIRDRNL